MNKSNLFSLLEGYNAGNIDDNIFEKYAIMMFLFSWFEELVFTEKKHIFDVMLGLISSNYDKLLTAFQISYIYRNKTFHGSKYLTNFSSFSKEIDIINDFMFSVVNCCLSKNYHGYTEVN